MDERMHDEHRERLKKIIATKITTVMVFPLSKFESYFGELFGCGLPFEQLTSDQKIYRKKYEEFRKEVMDMGNRQIRNSATELDMHRVEWLRYHTVLLPRDQNKENKQ